MEIELIMEPNVGIGPISFGMSPAAVTSILGAPDRTDEKTDPAPKLGLGWYYNAFDLDLFFHTPGLFGGPWNPQGPKLLVLLSCDNPDLTLWGEKLIGLDEAKVSRVLSGNGRHPVEELGPGNILVPYAEGEKVVRVGDLNLDLHYRLGRLELCQWRRLA